MDAMNSMSGGAVACPVCTLYLREGISLQKHLDTHPKEQVIEALIKASTSPLGVQVPSAPATAAAVAQPQQPPPLPTATNPTSSHSPYPIGPVFECPPIASMMPPQFASFSYQQFVNNGTMMIPQYAMAPQANQMMQMLYNPYGAMYQQQQIPAVQMIAPVSNMQTPTRMRSMVSVASETTARSNVATMNSELEPKQILPEIEAESEVDQVLPDVQHLSREPQNTNQHETEQDNQLRLERRQITQNPSPPPQDNRTNNQINYQTAVQNLSATDEEVGADVDKEESVLPDIEDVQSPRSTPQIQQVTIHYDNAQQMPNGEQFTSCYGMNAGKGHNVETTTTIIDSEMEPQDENGEAQRTSEQCTRSICQNSPEIVINDQSKSSTHPPEVEQLERLLITIMETQFNADSLTHKEESRGQGDKNIEATVQVSNANSQENDREILDFRKIDQDDDDKTVQLESCDEYEAHADSDPLYSYKNSLSAPASPATRQQLQRRRTYSMRSELGSTENLSSYPIGFEATTLQHEEDEDVDGHDKLDDNFNEEDMEIEEIASPHTPFTKHDNSDCIRSHTPLSTISGISGLRVRTDLSKPCSPASAHSFHHMDTNSLCADDDDADEMLDPESEKDPIDCSQLEKEAAVMESLKNNLQSSIYDHKLQPNHVYHQSVITENVSSFPVGNHSQKPMIIHDTYSISNCRNTDNLLDLSEPSEATTSTDSKNFQSTKSIIHKPTSEILNINEDAHPGPMNVLEFDGLQILVPSTFVSESSQKAVSATSRQSMASSEGGIEVDEEVKSVSMRADETMPPRGELSEQESNGCHEPSAWQLYMGQESSRMSTSYDLMARESWEESEGSDNEIGGPLLDSRSLATHFTSSLFLDRDRKTPTKRMFKCPHCTEVFDCPKERRVHTSTIHKDAGPSGSRDPNEPSEVKDIKLLEGRMNMFDDIFVPTSHAQQPLLHQLQPAHKPDLAKLEVDQKADGLVIPVSVEVSCTVCGQQFTSEKSLQIHHRRVHHGESTKRVRENAKCQTCNEEFPSVVLFNTHLKIHPLECGQCGKYFYRKQNFKLHMKRHLGIKPFPCTVCDKAFLTKQKLDEHTNGHTGNAPVKCNLCNETFKRYSNLTQHKNRHHLNIKKKLKDYICHCGEVFHTKKKLAWHKETHDEKPKACTYCNERFIHMASLTRHMRRAHNRRFVPDAQRENENVECPICKCIYLRSSLAVHMRVHNGERPYECQVCSKAFSTKWNLQLHKWTHAARSTKPFKCNQCSAAFYRHSDYTAHMNSHRNVRPYTCNYCGAQFIRKYNCLRHVKEHEENKSYTCDICNKTFHRSYYLKEHLRVHSGARPYTCHICGKSSSTKSNHNKHVRIHHAREPVNTEN